MDTRLLAYKDAFVWELVQTIQDDSCIGESVPLDNDYNLITLEMNAAMWTKLFSSVLTGSDLVYPNESHEILWAWLKGVECSMSFCARMIDCFQNDQDVRIAMIQALIYELLNNPVQGEAWVSAMMQLGLGRSSGGNATGEPKDGIMDTIYDDSCDFDTLYGKCFATVDALDRVSTDVLQVVEVLTNINELIAEQTDNIPVLAPIVSVVGDFFVWIQDSIAENYFAAYNISTQEFWACKIYCLTLNDDCVLDFDKMISAYRDELLINDPPPLNSPIEVILQWLSTLIGLAPNLVVGAMHYFVLSVFARSGAIYGSNFTAIGTALQTASPIEPPCNDCERWCYTFDFTQGTQGFTVVPNRGGIQTSEGWEGTQWVAFDARNNGVNIERNFGFSFNVTHIELHYDQVVLQNDNGAGFDRFITLLGGNLVDETIETSVTQPVGHTLSWNGNADIDYIFIGAIYGLKGGSGNFNPPENAGSGHVVKLVMQGEGSNPFGSDNC